MRLTGRGAGLLGTSLALGFTTVLLASPALGIVTAASMLALAAAAALVTAAPRERRPASLSVPAVYRGEVVTVNYRLPASRTLLRTELDLGITGQDSITVAGSPQQAGDDPQAWATPLRATRHGIVTIGPPALVQTDPFALCRRRIVAGRADRLLVRPGRVPLTQLWTHQRRQADAPGLGIRSEAGEFDTLRAYEVGDDVRLIHWPNSARSGEVLVRRFVEPPAPELVLLHDTAESSYATAEDFEQAVDFSASIVTAAVVHGATLRFCTTTGDRVWSWSGQSKSDRDIAEVFAEIQPAKENPGLRPSALAAMATVATCTVVSGDRADALAGMLSRPGLPARITLVCLGSQGPDDILRRWSRASTAMLIEAADARHAAAQWSTFAAVR